MVTYLAIPGFSFLIVCAPLISELWIGRNEPVFVGTTILLSAGWLVNTLSTPAYFASLGTGEMRINLLSHIVMTVANILLALCLGLAIGGLGVVAGWAIALAIGGVLLNNLYCSKNSILLSSLISDDDRTLLPYIVSSLGISYLGWQILPGAVEVLLAPLDVSNAWDTIITNTIIILVYLTILIIPMWKHSMRSDIQRWLGRSFARKTALPVSLD